MDVCAVSHHARKGDLVSRDHILVGDREGHVRAHHVIQGNFACTREETAADRRSSREEIDWVSAAG